MNKEQEQIAEKIIIKLKEQSGSSFSKFDDLFPEEKRFKIKHIVFGALKERGLIKGFPADAYGLTEKGWEFKSFDSLRRKKIFKKLKKNMRM